MPLLLDFREAYIKNIYNRLVQPNIYCTLEVILRIS